LFSKINSLIAGSLRETVNGVIYRKIASPDSSGKPMPVENHFFSGGSRATKGSSCQRLEKGFETK
jgi:hypothetical protein